MMCHRIDVIVSIFINTVILSQHNLWPYQKHPGTRCPGTVVTVNADLEWVNLNVGLTLH